MRDNSLGSGISTLNRGINKYFMQIESVIFMKCTLNWQDKRRRRGSGAYTWYLKRLIRTVGGTEAARRNLQLKLKSGKANYSQAAQYAEMQCQLAGWLQRWEKVLNRLAFISLAWLLGQVSKSNKKFSVNITQISLSADKTLMTFQSEEQLFSEQPGRLRPSQAKIQAMIESSNCMQHPTWMWPDMAYWHIGILGPWQLWCGPET